MKTIGLLGGMSWESTISYYQIINEAIKEKLGALYSAKIVLYSVNFQEIEELQRQGRWDECAVILGAASSALERAGADFIVLCTNTMHRVIDQIQSHCSIPFLHIADITAAALVSQGIKTVSLLGTSYTMEGTFYRTRLEQAGLTVMIPDPAQREALHAIIFEELCLGIVTEKSRQVYIDVMNQMHEHGSQAAILGCTEIGLLIKQQDVSFPLFDTTYLHAAAAAAEALKTS